MLKKAMYFLFALSFLTTFNGYADEEVAANVDTDEVSSPDSNEANVEVEATVVDNTSEADQEKDQ